MAQKGTLTGKQQMHLSFFTEQVDSSRQMGKHRAVQKWHLVDLPPWLEYRATVLEVLVSPGHSTQGQLLTHVIFG